MQHGQEDQCIVLQPPTTRCCWLSFGRIRGAEGDRMQEKQRLVYNHSVRVEAELAMAWKAAAG
jgi:hypothetical protein